MKRIDEMTKDERIQLQRELIRYGYLAPVSSRGRPADDGIMGPVSMAAYEAYLADLPSHIPLVAPAPAKPWWQSRRGQGLIKMGVGLALGIVGNFWAPAANVDSQLLLDTIFGAMPSILEALGIGIGAWGASQSAVGAAQAHAPLTLRAPRTGVGQLQHPHVPSSATRSSQPSRPDVDQARGHFGDDS